MEKQSVLTECTHGALRYLIRFPQGYREGEKYPVLLMLHGAGGRGTDINILKSHPFFGIPEKPESPFVAVAPQCHADSWFDLFEQLIGFAEALYHAPFTDKSRFYAIGASMGGYATWQLGMSCPSLFAAILPICGGGMYWNAGRLKNVAVWAFHGDSDATVFPEESRKMVDAVNRCGGKARLTLYESCGHDAWSATYTDPAVFEWLFSQRKQESTAPASSFRDLQIYG